jgi:hypothetical protein
MSPVKQTKARQPRSMVLAVAGIVIGIILVLVVFVVAVPSLTESGKVEVKLGSDTYDAGPSESRAATIAEDGPLLFSDVSGGQRDIYLQHIGDDPATGWYAFDARRPGQGRDCPLDWDATATQFRDRCDGTIVAADGTGLLTYTVTVTDNGRVVVDFKGDDSTTTTDFSTTTSSILVTQKG